MSWVPTDRVAVVVLIGLAKVAALTVTAASPSAASIAFVNGGNVWLAARDGGDPHKARGRRRCTIVPVCDAETRSACGAGVTSSATPQTAFTR